MRASPPVPCRCTVLCACTLAGLAACSSGYSQQEGLAESVTLFADAVRWQKWDEASSQVAPERRGTFLKEHENLPDSIEVTDVEVLQRSAGPDRRSVVVRLAVSWVAKDNPVVRKSIIEQLWECQQGAWFVTSERTVRGESFPPAQQKRSRQSPASAKASRHSE